MHHRRFRTSRLTVSIYACVSLCAFLLILNYNEGIKGLTRQKPTNVPETRHPAHSKDGTTNFPGDAVGVPTARVPQSQAQAVVGDNKDTSRLHLDENLDQSNAGKKSDYRASGLLTKSPKDSTTKPWFMRHGSRFPAVATSQDKLWWEENPDSDRIVEQLMYLTAQDAQGVVGTPPYFPARFPLGVFDVGNEAEKNSHKGIPESSGMLLGKNTANISSLSQPTTRFPQAVAKESPALKTLLLYYDLAVSWRSGITSGRDFLVQERCPINACRLTGNRSQINEADLVVFKDVFMLPKLRRVPEQLWAIYMLESPLNTEKFMDKNVFNLTATYRHDSDIVTPYEKWVYYDEKVRTLPQGN